MNVTLDTELNGMAIVFDSVNDLLDGALKADPAGKVVADSASTWSRQRTRTWDEVRSWLNSPGSEEMDIMMEVAPKIRKAIVEPPVAIRRQRRWSENDGELDVDRALRGAPDLFHESFRMKRPRTQNIAVMCDASANAGTSNLTLMYRAAAAVVACDLLEEQGYSCEVWVYDMGRNTYTDGKGSFVVLPAKTAGDPMDVDSLVKAMSPRMFRSAMFASYHLGGPVSWNYGSTTTEDRERWFSRHCQIDANFERVWMPSTTSLEMAALAVRDIIQSIQQPA